MFDIRDLVSLACLTNTPFPNNFAVAATGIDRSDMKPEDYIEQVFASQDCDYIVKNMRLFVAYGLGDLDKDMGPLIQKLMWNYYEELAKKRGGNYGADSGDVEEMRHAIYGPCAHAGYDFTGYQPCAPTWPHHIQIKTLKDWQSKYLDAKTSHDKNWPHRFAMARIKLAEEWEKGVGKDKFFCNRWPYLVDAMARGLNVNAKLLAAGLKGEF